MADETAPDRAIHDLLAKQEIQEAIYRYCRGEDRLDAALSTSLWHADGSATYGFGGGLFDGPVTQWAQTVHAGLATYSGSAHQVSNILIEVDGDRAASEAYVTARLWRITEGMISEHVTIGRYLDQWSRRGGVWAADHRRFIFDLTYVTTADMPSPDKARPWESDPDWFEGRHGGADPSYDLMGSVTRRFTRDGGADR